MENVNQKKIIKINILNLIKDAKDYTKKYTIEKNSGNVYVKQYLNTKFAIELLDISCESIKDIEDSLINGIYKEQIIQTVDLQKYKSIKQFSYMELAKYYCDQIKLKEEKENRVIASRTLQQILFETRNLQIDYIARLCANLDFSRINLMNVANFSKKEIVKTYKKAIDFVKSGVEITYGNSRTMIRDNKLGKIQYVFSKFILDNCDVLSNLSAKELDKKISKAKKTSKRKKMNFIKYFLTFKIDVFNYVKTIIKNIKNKTAYLEQGNNYQEYEIQITTLKYLLETYFTEDEFYGCFADASIEDKIKVFEVEKSQIEGHFDMMRKIYILSGQLIQE